MELIYLYIEDDGRNIKDCEFNFSPEYRFHYNKKNNELTGEKLDFVENFWEAVNISNITAVIGKNGAGKSNFLHLITNSLDIKKNVVYVKKVGSGYLNIYSTIQELKNNLNLQCDFLSQSLAICSPTIFYNTNVYNHLVHVDINSIDVSIQKNVIEDSARFIRKESIYANNIWLYHSYSNTIKQLEFLIDYPKIDQIKLPEKCFIRSSFMPLSRTDSYNKQLREFSSKLSKFVANSMNGEQKAGRTNVEKAYLYASLIYELYCYCLDSDIELDWGDPTFLHYYARSYIISSIFQKNQDKEIGTLLIEMIQLIESSDMEYDNKNNGFLVSFHSAQLLFNKYFKLISLYKEKIRTKSESERNTQYLQKEVFEQKLDIEWEYNMSSGEQMYLSFYSNIYYAKKKLKKKADYLYLVMDEPEIAFHPEWQRNFISNLVNFISEIFTEYKVQLIIASHSPILVSDFPKNNIIFLNKDENGNCKVEPSISRNNTFGANIHTLYRNSFFLDGIPIGQFAKNKINKLFDILENEKEINDDILNRIQLIGEPLIRDQLMKLYRYKKGLPEDTERRIKKLEEEIEILKSKLKNDKN